MPQLLILAAAWRRGSVERCKQDALPQGAVPYPRAAAGSSCYVARTCPCPTQKLGSFSFLLWQCRRCRSPPGKRPVVQLCCDLEPALTPWHLPGEALSVKPPHLNTPLCSPRVFYGEKPAGSPSPALKNMVAVSGRNQTHKCTRCLFARLASWYSTRKAQNTTFWGGPKGVPKCAAAGSMYSRTATFSR